MACRALSSMQRAADRLCALDPGPRCAAARAKVADATERVRAACPECDVGADARPPAPTPAASPPEDEAKGPPAEAPKGGGCAGCTVAPEDDAGAGALAAGLLVALAIAARGRRRGPGRAARGAGRGIVAPPADVQTNVINLHFRRGVLPNAPGLSRHAPLRATPWILLAAAGAACASGPAPTPATPPPEAPRPATCVADDGKGARALDLAVRACKAIGDGDETAVAPIFRFPVARRRRLRPGSRRSRAGPRAARGARRRSGSRRARCRPRRRAKAEAP